MLDTTFTTVPWDGERRVASISAAILAHGLLIGAFGLLAVIRIERPALPDRPPGSIVLWLPPPEARVEPRPRPPQPRPGPQSPTPPAAAAVPVRSPDPQPAGPPAPSDVQPTRVPETVGSDLSTPDGRAGTGGVPNGTGSGPDTGPPDGPTGEGGPEGTGEGPYEPGGGIARPELIHKVAPAYPVLERVMRREGRVELRAIIAADGTVRDITVVHATSPGFEAAALEAVRQWTYRPGSREGRSVSVYLTVVVEFTLN